MDSTLTHLVAMRGTLAEDPRPAARPPIAPECQRRQEPDVADRGRSRQTVQVAYLYARTGSTTTRIETRQPSGAAGCRRSREARSTTTRIETSRMVAVAGISGQSARPDPRQQGLKPEVRTDRASCRVGDGRSTTTRIETERLVDAVATSPAVGERDPRQQGLKPRGRRPQGRRRSATRSTTTRIETPSGGAAAASPGVGDRSTTTRIETASGCRLLDDTFRRGVARVCCVSVDTA